MLSAKLILCTDVPTSSRVADALREHTQAPLDVQTFAMSQTASLSEQLKRDSNCSVMVVVADSRVVCDHKVVEALLLKRLRSVVILILLGDVEQIHKSLLDEATIVAGTSINSIAIGLLLSNLRALETLNTPTELERFLAEDAEARLFDGMMAGHNKHEKLEPIRRFRSYVSRLFPQSQTERGVGCTIIAPDKVKTKSQFIIEVHLHPASDAITNTSMPISGKLGDRLWRGSVTLPGTVQKGADLQVSVSCADAEIQNSIRIIRWLGGRDSLAFDVSLPRSATYMFAVAVDLHGVPLSRYNFTIEAQSNAASNSVPIGNGKRYRKAFFSYASQDRIRVLEQAQFSKLCGIDVFQDVLALAPGERWRGRLFDEIQRSDLFILFWSTASAGSDYVRMEAEHALECFKTYGVPDIRPFIMDGPPPPHAPLSLSELHLNDPIRHIIAAEARSAYGLG